MCKTYFGKGSETVKKTILQHIIILFAIPLLGLILLIAAFLLPVDSMREHVYWSMDAISEEFDDEMLINGFKASLTGNFTDCLMLEQAIYENKEHSLLNSVLHIYRGESSFSKDEWMPGVSLADYLGGAEQLEVEYSRYWHGYLIVLKPLLMIFSLSSLRLFNSALQLLCVGICVILMTEKKRKGLAPAFLFSLPFLYFVSTFASLSLSICLYITLFGVIFLLLKEDYLKEKKALCLYFLILGMFTSYFDFLTYPIVTLGFPLCVCLYSDKSKAKESLLHTLVYSAEWGFGYIWMWASKWIIADVLSDCTTIKDAMHTISERTQSAEGYSRGSGFLQVLKSNLGEYANRGFAVLTCLIAIMVLCVLIKRIKNVKEGISSLIPFLPVAVYPFAWWFLTQNHSSEHSMFTCRIFSVCIFALLTAIASMTEDKKTETFSKKAD